MVIKSFKIFERGDGIEEENDNLPSKGSHGKQLTLNFDNPEESCPKDYILGIPSGEVVIIDNLKHFKEVVDRKLARYTNSFRGQKLNCYCCPDSNIEKVKNLVKELKGDETGNNKFKEICKEYRDWMRVITGGKYPVGYLTDGMGIDRYFLIISDKEMARLVSQNLLNKMSEVAKNMREIYPNSVFSFTDKVSNPTVKYYGLS